jgi:hypothetical protein
MVEGNVFLEDDNQVFDGRGSFVFRFFGHRNETEGEEQSCEHGGYTPA